MEIHCLYLVFLILTLYKWLIWYFSLLEASRAGADVMQPNGKAFTYPSYVEDIMVSIM